MTAGTALVTGATGFVGSHLVRRLVAEGFEVHALRRPHTDPWRLRDVQRRIRMPAGDLGDAGRLREIVSQARPDFVFHLAAAPFVAGQTGGPDEVVAGNLVATANLLEACAGVDYRVFVHTGEAFEYRRSGAPLAESDPCSPCTPYAVAKHAATRLALRAARDTGRPIVAVRPFSAYGPDDHAARLVPQAIAAALAGSPMAGSRPDAVRDYVYVEDVAECYLAAARATGISGAVFNIGSGRGTTSAGVIEIVVRLLGRTDVRWGAFPASVYDETPWVADTRRTSAVLGWTARTSLEEGIERTIAARP